MSVESKPWFFADATRLSAEALLGKAPPNSFLVRGSSKPNCYAMSQSLPNGAFKHALIIQTELGRYTLEGTKKSFASVESLVQALKLTPLLQPPAPLVTKISDSTIPDFPSAPTSNSSIPEFPTAPNSNNRIPDFPSAPLDAEPSPQPPLPQLTSTPSVNLLPAHSPTTDVVFAYATVPPTTPPAPIEHAIGAYTTAPPVNAVALDNVGGAYTTAPPVATNAIALDIVGGAYSIAPPAFDPRARAIVDVTSRASYSPQSGSPKAQPNASKVRAASPPSRSAAPRRGSPPARGSAPAAPLVHARSDRAKSPPPRAAQPLAHARSDRAKSPPPRSSGAGTLRMSPIPPPKSAVAVASVQAVRNKSPSPPLQSVAPRSRSGADAPANDVDANAQLIDELDRMSIKEHALFWRRQTQVVFAVPHQSLLGHARRDAVLRAMLTKELVVVLALRDAVTAAERDDLCEALVLLLEPSNMALYAIEAVIAVEVAGTLSEGTLFRTNSVASKMMSCYAKRLPDGANYLRTVLDPLIRDVCSGRYGSLEVNPDHAAAGDDPTRNMQTLIQLSRSFLNAILDALHMLPVGLQHLCAHLRSCVQQRFANEPASGNAVLTAIGGFLFLRFFCPAIVAPETHGFVDEPPHRDVRRILVLISKALQNLSNRTPFREKYMGAMNAFVEANQAKVVDYLHDAAVLVHGSGAVPVRQPVPDDEREAAFVRVHRLAAPHLSDIEARARVLFPSVLDLALEQTAAFANAMAELGAPPPADGKSPSLSLSQEQQQQQQQQQVPRMPKKDSGASTSASSITGFFGKLQKRSQERRNVRDANTLFHALHVGDDATAFQLLSKNVELLSATNDVGMTPIIAAANAGNAALVKYLLEQKADCFVADRNGWTVLHAACFAKRDDIVEVLLNESHIDVAAKNEDGNTPLHYFARSRHDPAVLKRLLRTFATRGADLNARNNIGEVPLHAAAWKANVQMAQALLRAGASALLRNDAGQSARTIARLTNNAELDAVLDEAGAPKHDLDRKVERATARPASPDATASTALPLESPRTRQHGGSGGGSGERSPRSALSASAAPATAGAQATSPMAAPRGVLAASASMAAIAVPDLDLATLRDSTILQTSASTGTQQFLADVAACRAQAVRNALAGAHRDALLKARGAHGATALHLLAASGGDQRAVALAEHVVKLGADVNAVDEGGFTPTALAVYRNNQPVLRMLMTAAAADVRIANQSGNTALHYLHRLSPVDHLLVRSLIQIAPSALIDSLNQAGDSPLHLAVANGAVDVCELLLTSGASPDVRNAAGLSVIDAALAAGRTDLLFMLKDAQRKLQQAPQPISFVAGAGDYVVMRPLNVVDASDTYNSVPAENAAPPMVAVNRVIDGYLVVGYEQAPVDMDAPYLAMSEAPIPDDDDDNA